MRRVDVAIVGGGPAGLAAGIEAARRGLSAVVVERQAGVADKACGEGLMPSGVRALDRLGALKHLGPDASAPFVGIRYHQEDGSGCEGHFHDGAGLGIRRLALWSAMEAAARDAGVELLQGAAARDVKVGADAVTLTVNDEPLTARILVAADGLASPLRQAAGLTLLDEGRGRRRFGLRRHFVGVQGSDHVEVHWSDGLEAYVTPVGPGRAGVAFLYDERKEPRADFEAFLSRFPAVQARLGGAAPDSSIRGAGPLARRVRAVVQGRLVLLGDAAGYVDAITGEGLTLAFASARALGEVLPAALAGGEAALRPYARAHARLFRWYALNAGSLVWLSRHPALRRGVIRALSLHPSLFSTVLRIVA
jgi:flavin-dependent dehydrogenase